MLLFFIQRLFCLFHISTHHPDYLSRDGHRRKLGRKVWRSSCVKLWNVLWRSGPEAIGEEATYHLLKTGMSFAVIRKFSVNHRCRIYVHLTYLNVKKPSWITKPNVACVSVLDWEVEQGLGGKQPPEEFSHCYKRIITDLLYNLKNEYAPQFIDLHKGRSEINQTLHQAQQRFIRNIHLKVGI